MAQVLLVGTMPIAESAVITLEPYDPDKKNEYTIETGYYGEGVVTVNAKSLADVTYIDPSVAAKASDIVYPYTGIVNGETISGNISTQNTRTEARSYTKSSANKNLLVYFNRGFYKDGSQVLFPQAYILEATGILSSNIAYGTEMLGIKGTYTQISDTDAPVEYTDDIKKGYVAYANGKRYVGTLAAQPVSTPEVSMLGNAVKVDFTTPAKGPYAGIIIQVSTLKYPTSDTDGTRVYIGQGSVTKPSSRSSAIITTGLRKGTKYYFSIFGYSNGLQSANPVHVEYTPI